MNLHSVAVFFSFFALGFSASLPALNNKVIGKSLVSGMPSLFSLQIGLLVIVDNEMVGGGGKKKNWATLPFSQRKAVEKQRHWMSQM